MMVQSTTTPLPLDSRPEHIENILGGLDRYNPETVSIFQDYVQFQCENRTYDCLANLALLKLYVTRVFFRPLPRNNFFGLFFFIGFQ